MPTIKRRIKHKMTYCGIETIEKYIRYIEETENEIHELYLDLLIHVTGFFRDCEVFQYLYLSLFPQLLKQKTILEIWLMLKSYIKDYQTIGKI
jgi:two-component system CheB/CheR fusion protein